MLKHCALCGGEVVPTKTTYKAVFHGVTASISDVPCFQCQKCGERYFDENVSRRLDVMLHEFPKTSKHIVKHTSKEPEIAERIKHKAGIC